MKKLSLLLISVFVLGWVFQSCNNDKTYAEMKKEEKEAIQRYIEKNNIKVISFEQFQEQDSTTDVKENEFVLLSETGVYMQIVDRGNGKLLEDGRYEVLARYVEEQILSDGATDTLSLNNNMNVSLEPDEFTLTKSGKNYSASFTTGVMPSTYNSSYVPGGWLIPFQYITAGREIAGRSRIRLIVPHSQGQSVASAYVYPCYYEITYQLGR